MKPQLIEDICFKKCIESNFTNLREKMWIKLKTKKKERKTSRCKQRSRATNETNFLTKDISLGVYHYLIDFY